MRRAPEEDVRVGGFDDVIRAIVDLMDAEAAGAQAAVLARTIRRRAALDLEDDDILCVVRDAGDHGHDARSVLERLLFLSSAEAERGPAPR